MSRSHIADMLKIFDKKKTSESQNPDKVKKLLDKTLCFSHLSLSQGSGKFIYSLLICILYACSDEIHQLLVPGRSGEIRDIIIDGSGSSIMILMYYFYLKLFVKKRNYVKIKVIE